MKNILLFGSLLIILYAAFAIYSNTATYKPSEFAISKLTNEKLDIVNDNEIISFSNKTNKQDRGVIVYPGGYVDPVSYAPLCSELALNGITCVIPKMPFNLAIFGITKADSVFELFPYITNWYLGGHSLGGPMVSRYIQKNDNPKIKGVFYLASYTDVDISDKKLACVTITGSLDNVLKKDQYESDMNNLPKDCKKVEIVGGNHSQFGSYGLQNGDNDSKTTFDQQLFEVVDELDTL